MNFSPLKCVCALLFFIFILLAGYSFLPYKTMRLDFQPIEALENRSIPTPNFQIGRLQWDVEYYSRTPDLKDFRQYFNEHCRALEGVAAAACISDNLWKNMSFGDPQEDAFSRNYHPAEDLHRHLLGEAGHCVTFSALSADMLLSAGIPAMLVQIQSAVNGGHNVLSVWDKDSGWVYFDPLNRIVMKRGGRLTSALNSMKFQDQVHWEVYGGRPEDLRVMKAFYVPRLPFDGAIIYPEPWYYTRTGPRTEGLFFRGRGIGTGIQSFQMGIAQTLLRTCILAAALILLALLVVMVNQKIFPPRLRLATFYLWLKLRRARRQEEKYLPN